MRYRDVLERWPSSFVKRLEAEYHTLASAIARADKNQVITFHEFRRILLIIGYDQLRKLSLQEQVDLLLQYANKVRETE